MMLLDEFKIDDGEDDIIAGHSNENQLQIKDTKILSKKSGEEEDRLKKIKDRQAKFIAANQKTVVNFIQNIHTLKKQAETLQKMVLEMPGSMHTDRLAKLNNMLEKVNANAKITDKYLDHALDSVKPK